MSQNTENKGLARRTIVRGGILTTVPIGVWTTPVVSASATAPKTTASPEPPKFGELQAWKLPGHSTDVAFGYLFLVPFSGTEAQLRIDAVNLNGRFFQAECQKSVIIGSTRYLQWVVKNTNSRNGRGDVVLTYTFRNESLVTETLPYNGTRPYRGDTSMICK